MLKKLLFLSTLLICTFTTIAAAQVTSISQNAETIGLYQKFELTFTLSQSYSNPFDTDIVDIMVTFTKPDGNSIDVPAFFYQEYDENSSGDFVNGRNPCWKVRFAPSQIGIYVINRITITDQNGINTYDTDIAFTCIDSDAKGIIRIDKRNCYYLQYDNNEPYIPIGHNVAWWNENGTGQWRDTFAKMNGVGENWTRIWMTHFYQGTALEWRSNKRYYDGVGVFSMPIAWRLDRIIESCEQNGISIQLVLQHHGQFSTLTNPNWNDNPYNIIYADSDGGFLNRADDFFTDAEARRITKHKYRYIIARWGYSPAILAWEIFNEVQFTDGWQNNPASVVDWHDEMAHYIKSIDPFGHLVTTSSDKSGFEDIWCQDCIDLVQVHYYSSYVINFFNEAFSRLSIYNKPVIMGEFGDFNLNDIEEGCQVLHNGIWSAFHVNSGANLWWWDNFIERYNLYDEFAALSAYAEGEDPADCNLHKADIETPDLPLWASATPGLEDFWAISTKTFFDVQPDGTVPGMGNLSQWLQGTSKDELGLRSDPTFNIDIVNDAVLRIHVMEVSGWGNNRLRVLVDGREVFSSSYANGSRDFVIEVPIPTGCHSVQIQNTGQDWFHISCYEFKEEGSEGYLGFVGLSGDERAFIWIYDTGNQKGGTPYGTFHDVKFVLNDLKKGNYIAESYKTRGVGGVIDSSEVSCEGGQLMIELPDFERDIAVKVKPASISYLN